MKITHILVICSLIVASVLIAGCGGEARIAQDGNQVSVHYVGTLDDGMQFDSSRDRGAPLSFVVGAGEMIAGFDNAVKGMKVGETKTVRLLPEEAYGAYNEELLIEFSRDELPEGMENPQVGDLVVLSLQTGGMVQKPIVEVTDTYIIVDANHELAGEALTFEIELLSVE